MRPLKVFLCHASQDKPAVRDLYRRLVRDGVSVWMDENNLLPGMDWQLEIPRAVRDADAIIVCLSKNSINKEGYIQKEIRFALDIADEKPDGTIYLLPVRLEECEIPPRLTRWQWVDVFSNAGYRKLRISLRLRADSLGAKMNTPSRASAHEPAAKSTFPLVNILKGIAVFFLLLFCGALIIWLQGNIPAWETAAPTSPAADVQGEMPLAMPVMETSSPTPFQPAFLPPATNTPWLAVDLPSSAVPFASITASAIPSLSPSMALIPGGMFIMGRENGSMDEIPAHRVQLDAFYIDQYEVTNGMYIACENSGVCAPPSGVAEMQEYHSGNVYLNYPVVNVSWEMAQTYCAWRGGRLPTEAEWEKAARGGLDGALYPWGNEAPTCDLNTQHGAQFAPCPKNRTLSVAQFLPNGYQIHDMAGNVWEWVADYYDPDYYLIASPLNPLGPLSERENRVIRGGGWEDEAGVLYVSNRGKAPPHTQDNEIGFRCAKNHP